MCYLWFPWQLLVMLDKELPDVGVISSHSPSSDWLIILEIIRKNTLNLLNNTNKGDKSCNDEKEVKLFVNPCWSG